MAITDISGVGFTDQTPQNILFVGNPGSGKSALVNALFGSAVQQSGISIGEGLTTQFSAHEINYKGTQYRLIDTPGFAEIDHTVRNIQEIQKALSLKGSYKIFFVVKLESGRVIDQDIETIDSVMHALREYGSEYSLIVNQVDENVYKKIKAEGLPFDIGVYPTKSFRIIKYEQALACANNFIYKLPEEFLNFIYGGAGFDINLDKGPIKIIPNATTEKRIGKKFTMIKEIPELTVVDFEGIKQVGEIKDEVAQSNDSISAKLRSLSLKIQKLFQNIKLSMKSLTGSFTRIFDNVKAVCLTAWERLNSLSGKKVIIS